MTKPSNSLSISVHPSPAAQKQQLLNLFVLFTSVFLSLISYLFYYILIRRLPVCGLFTYFFSFSYIWRFFLKYLMTLAIYSFLLNVFSLIQIILFALLFITL